MGKFLPFRMNIRRWGTLDPFIEPGGVLGRKVANRGFLEALLAQDPFDEYHFFLTDTAALAHQQDYCRSAFPQLFQRGAFHFFPQNRLHLQLEATPYTVFHLSDPITTFTRLARLRNAYAPVLFPITGTTHSLSYERFMPAFLGHLWGGATARDAIVGTSQAAIAMLEHTFALLRQNYPCPATAHGPQLKRIPLGANPLFSAPAGHNPRQYFAGQGAAMRARLGLGTETMFLCLARLTVHSKMDLAPLLCALQRAAGKGLSLNDTVLVVAGWAEENAPLPQALAAMAQRMGIRFIPFLRPTNEECLALYAAADVFVSPSDNIQETFGLTLAEAGSMGLPVIASNFNGYRDIVVHGETGLLVPTIGPESCEETNLLAGTWFDNQYHLRLAQQTCVSVPGLAKALAQLGTNPALRQAMGMAGAARARSHFSWPAIAAAHVGLWQRLASTPLPPQDEARIRNQRHPLAPNFAHSFRAHFSHTLGPESTLLVRRTPTGDAVYQGRVPPLLYAGMELMIEEESLRRMLLATRKPVMVKNLLGSLRQQWPTAQQGIAQERAAMVVLWALKHDYLEEVDASADESKL